MGNSKKEWKMVALDWPSLKGKCRSIFPRASSRPGIIESTHVLLILSPFACFPALFTRLNKFSRAFHPAQHVFPGFSVLTRFKCDSWPVFIVTTASDITLVLNFDSVHVNSSVSSQMAVMRGSWIWFCFTGPPFLIALFIIKVGVAGVLLDFRYDRPAESHQRQIFN